MHEIPLVLKPYCKTHLLVASCCNGSDVLPETQAIRPRNESQRRISGTSRKSRRNNEQLCITNLQCLAVGPNSELPQSVRQFHRTKQKCNIKQDPRSYARTFCAGGGMVFERIFFKGYRLVQGGRWEKNKMPACRYPSACQVEDE